MESFMCAPVGSLQKGVGDADGGSAPHRKHSIAIATGPRQIAAAAIGLTSPLRCSYSATAAFRAFKMPRKRTTPISDSQPVRRPLAALEHVRIGPAGWSYSDWTGYVYPSPRNRSNRSTTSRQGQCEHVPGRRGVCAPAESRILELCVFCQSLAVKTKRGL